MNRKNLPLLLMLTAGAITCIITFVQKFTMVKRLTALFVVLLLFWILGSILKWTLDRFDMQNEKKRSEEKEAIDSETAESDGNNEGQGSFSDGEGRETEAE